MSNPILDKEERQFHIDFMKDPNRWPCWPCCPLKGGPGNWGEGLLLEAGMPIKPVVYHVNMFHLPDGPVAEWPQTEYQDFDALLDAGWKVD